jgi:hypothetical protein
MAHRPITPGPVALDINKIIHAPKMDQRGVQHRAILHTVKDDINITELISIETSRDYANDIADYILVSFVLVMGEYIKKVHPNMDNLEMSIITSRYNIKQHVRYKAVIVSGETNVTGSIYSSYSIDELNKLDKLSLEIQCVSRTVEALRHTNTYGVYAYSSVKDVISTIMHNNMKDTHIDGSPLDVNFSMVTPNNEKTYRHISIPLGTGVLDLPTYLHNTEYGVYSAGIGTYIQNYSSKKDSVDMKDTIFIYPMYNQDLAKKPGRKLMILSSPDMTLSMIENSYLIDADVVKIIGSGDMQGNEISQSRLISNGSAIITTKTDSIMIDGLKVTDGSVKTDRKVNLVGEVLKRKTDELDGARYHRPTSNPYVLYSDRSRDMLSHYKVTWNYSNPDLLYPGMPVIYIYDDADHGVVRLYGVLHSNFTKYNAMGKSHATILNVLLEPYVDKIIKSTEVVDVRR